MTPFLQLALALAIIILAAKLGGYVSYRLGQPTVLGELLVGIILGPTLLDLLHLPYFSDEHLSEVVHELAEIGVLLLMFIAGLGLHISDLAKSGKISTLGGVLGVTGVTLLESSGLGHLRRHGLREDLSIMPSMRDILAMDEVHHRTLLSVVDEQAQVDRMVAIAQQVIGDLEQAHTGFLFVVPVLEVHGLGKHRGDRSQE